MLLKGLDIVVNVINKINNVLLIAALAFMFILMMVQVFARFVFYFTLIWADDVTVFLLISSVFLGAGTAASLNRHIKLDFFININDNFNDNTLSVF